MRCKFPSNVSSNSVSQKVTFNRCHFPNSHFVVLVIINYKLIRIFFQKLPCNRFDKRWSYVSQTITFVLIRGRNIFLLFKNIGRSILGIIWLNRDRMYIIFIYNFLHIELLSYTLFTHFITQNNTKHTDRPIYFSLVNIFKYSLLNGIYYHVGEENYLVEEIATQIISKKTTLSARGFCAIQRCWEKPFHLGIPINFLYVY